ncbi:MAG: class I SAM-dependent methyltransferase [Dehalococcoidia bacterium]
MKPSADVGAVQHELAPDSSGQVDVFRILSLLPIRPYLTVADVGCGAGLFTIPMAKATWGGKVYALDTSEEMLESVKKRAQEARLGNIVTLKSEETKLPLEAGSLEGALLAFVLHEASDKAALLKAVEEKLEHRGWCAIIEWSKKAKGGEGPPQKQRLTEEDVVKLGVQAGLRVTLRRELSSHHYMVVLNK